MQFCELLRHQHASDEFFLHNIPFKDEASLRASVCSTFITFTSGHGELVYKVRFSVGVWARIVRDIVTDPYVLSDKLTAQRYRGFPETFVPGLLNMYLSLWGTGCGFSTTELQRTVGSG
jgi:hypothetical protein